MTGAVGAGVMVMVVGSPAAGFTGATATAGEDCVAARTVTLELRRSIVCWYSVARRSVSALPSNTQVRFGAGPGSEYARKKIQGAIIMQCAGHLCEISRVRVPRSTKRRPACSASKMKVVVRWRLAKALMENHTAVASWLLSIFGDALRWMTRAALIFYVWNSID